MGTHTNFSAGAFFLQRVSSEVWCFCTWSGECAECGTSRVKESQWTKMLDLCLSHVSVMWYGVSMVSLD